MDRSRFKLFSDPVHGFVAVPRGLLLDIVETPEFQRLRRIRQLGLGYLVFPAANHTRLEHALGAMALTHEALVTLQDKGTVITTDEVEGALAAALLHDVGHGPFSHTLETDLIGPDASGAPFHHEAMSRALMARLNERSGGRLSLALDLFDGTHERPFFHSLLSSQLDVDRMDYLRRDSFYTGVAEGVVGVDRIIKTMRALPVDGALHLVIEAKGAYAVESFVLSRRLMYWQVYLHKTVIAADHLLQGAIRRARACCEQGEPALKEGSPALMVFLENALTAEDIVRPEVLDAFVALDDTDVLYSLKRWATARDPVLADLSRRFLNRDLFRTHYLDAPSSQAQVEAWRGRVADWLVADGRVPRSHAEEAAALYLTTGSSRLEAYRVGKAPIRILERDGRIRDLQHAEGVAAVGAMSEPAVKPYVCHPKEVALFE